MLHKTKGISLIGMLLGVLIIGILLTIMLPKYTQSAKQSQTQSQNAIQNARNAVQQLEKVQAQRANFDPSKPAKQ